MKAPRCKVHGAMRRVETHTSEQRFCGKWWRCRACTTSALDMSPALMAQLARMKAASRGA